MLTEEEKTKRLVASKPAALAFWEDMPLIRDILSRPTSPAEARRLSAMLRRILVERDLTMIASPRIGKIHLLSPDNNPIYKAARQRPILFFASAGVKIYGTEFSGLLAFETYGPAGLVPLAAKMFYPPDWDSSKRAEYKLDTFLTQRVICLKGQWASRSDVIKYVANVSHGVHTGSPSGPNDFLLAQVSRANSYRFDGKGLAIDLFKHGINSASTELKYTPDAIDPVLVEVLSAARLLAESPDVIRLERVIAEEFGLAGTS